MINEKEKHKCFMLLFLLSKCFVRKTLDFLAPLEITSSKGIKYDLLFICNLIQLYCDEYEK